MGELQTVLTTGVEFCGSEHPRGVERASCSLSRQKFLHLVSFCAFFPAGKYLNAFIAATALPSGPRARAREGRELAPPRTEHHFHRSIDRSIAPRPHPSASPAFSDEHRCSGVLRSHTVDDRRARALSPSSLSLSFRNTKKHRMSIPRAIDDAAPVPPSYVVTQERERRDSIRLGY